MHMQFDIFPAIYACALASVTMFAHSW